MFYKFVRMLVYIYYCFAYRVVVHGGHNVPKTGGCIIACNHLRLSDPPALGIIMTRKVSFMAKEELFKIPLLGFILRKLGVVPVKRNSADIAAIKSMIGLVKAGEMIGIFPEGTRAKNSVPKNGIAFLAVKSRAPVIPMSISYSGKFRPIIEIRIGKPIVLKEYYDKKNSMDDFEKITNKIIIKKIKRLKAGNYP